MLAPPSTKIEDPEMYEDSSEDKKIIIWTKFSGVAKYPTGLSLSILSNSSFNFFFDSALVQEHEGKREKAGVLPRSVGDQTMMSARARVIAARVLAKRSDHRVDQRCARLPSQDQGAGDRGSRRER